MIDQFTTGKTYAIKLSVPVQFARPTVKALGPEPSPSGFRPRKIGKVEVHSVTLGEVEKQRFAIDRQTVEVVFTVLENPLPLLALLTIFGVAASFLTLSGSLLVRETRELVKAPGGAALGLAGIAVLGLGAYALIGRR